MNQILSTGDKQEKSNINSVIRFFCIIIIVFAMFYIVQGIYALVKNEDSKSISTGQTPDITVNSQGGSAIIDVKYNNAISKILYSWDDGEFTEIDAQNKTEISQKVIVPTGDCTLNISVVDVNGVEYKKQFDIKFDPNSDTVAPEVNISAVPGKITIKAEDNYELAYITYKWNDGQETKIEASGEDLSTITKEIEVKVGKNNLIVVAVDKAGNTKQEENEIIGVSKPKISVRKSGANLIIKVTDEEEVTKVEYNLNGTTYTKENTGENKKEFEFKQELQQGENIIVIKAYNNSGLTQEYTGKTTYRP